MILIYKDFIKANITLEEIDFIKDYAENHGLELDAHNETLALWKNDKPELIGIIEIADWILFMCNYSDNEEYRKMARAISAKVFIHIDLIAV